MAAPSVARRGRGRPPRTDEQRAAQRSRLLQAAMDAVRDQGADVSIDAIAAFIGVSKPVLYGEFGDKVGLADAVAVELAEQLERKVMAGLASTTEFDFPAGVRAVVEALITLITSEPELYAFLARSVRSSDRGFLDNALVRAIHERAAVLVALLTPGSDEAAISVLTDGLFGFMYGAIESWYSTGAPNQERLVEMLAAVIERGFQTAIAYATTPASKTTPRSRT